MNAKSEVPGIAAANVVRHKADGSCECITDEVAVEEPLELRIGRDSIGVTMRTPGDDTDLTAGFLLSEGRGRRGADVQEIAHCTFPASLGNVVNVTLSPGVQWNAASARRFGTISTSCGLCGKTSID